MTRGRRSASGLALVRDHALSELDDRFRATENPADLSYIAAEVLGRTLEVSRAGYGTIDTVSETIAVERDWNAPGISSIAGLLRFRDHGSYIEDLKRGETAIVSDAFVDPRTRGTAHVLTAINARSFINMPVTELGRFVALIFVNHDDAREWSADELAFMREMGQRTRAAVERRRAEIRLQRSEKRLGTALAIARLGTCEWVIATDELNLDERAAEIFGFAAGTELTGEQLFERIHPLDLDRVRAATLNAIANPDRLEEEYRIVLPSGVIRTVVSTNDFTLGPDGRAESTVGVFEDITERRTVEAELRALNETLESRVAERGAELERAQEALRQSQKLEAIGQLTGGVAHDFNNLLTVIGGSAELLRRPGLSEDRKEKYAEAITKTVARASKLTSQLLAFARRQSLKPETIDAVQSIEASTAIVRSLVGNGICVELRRPDTASFVNVDPGQLDTAIINMAGNARDAMGGRGTLAISIAGAPGIPAVRGHAYRRGAFVAISLTDTGAGIASENLGRIFEPFYSSKGVGQGTGLGLSQVFGFAKQSGGEIIVESREGAGATFTLYLPSVDAPDHDSNVLDEIDSVQGKPGGRILVVEDNSDVREFAVRMLTELGYETVEAGDGTAALIELERNASDFDVVFTDVMMPGMTGIELGHEIRRLYCQLPVVLASGYSDALAQEGAQGFALLHKPYSLEQLSRFLNQAKRV